MNRRLPLIILLIVCLSFVAYPAVVSAQPPYTVSIYEDVQYASHDDVPTPELFLKGDVYVPVEGGPHPAIMFMHGGSWQMADESLYADDWGPYLAERGYVVFAIQYRLSAADGSYPTWPGCLLDAKAALQYLRGSAEIYNVDPDRIAVGGDSAGGHLAALLALTQNWPAYEGWYPDEPFADVSTEVSAVVSAYGVFNMPNYWVWNKDPRFEWPDDTYIDDLIGGSPQELPGAYFEASPINYVRGSAKSLGDVSLPNAGINVPWFITWGTEDLDVPAEGQSIPFVVALKQAGADVTWVPVPFVGHYWFNCSAITGQSGLPRNCYMDFNTLQLICPHATPNDYIAEKFLAFLEENL